MRSRGTVFPIFAALVVTAASACEPATHENVDKWRHTEKGAGKLVATLGNGGLDPDLRAHAAQALVVSAGQTDRVVEILDGMRPDDRERVLDALIPRLWNDARLSSELQVPTAAQIAAKDALFAVRDHATPAQRDRIDGYLVDWLSGYYEGRAPLGRHHGEKIIRAIGPRAGAKLAAGARALLRDVDSARKVPAIQDILLTGLATTGAPEAVGFLLELVRERKHPDPSLPARAMRALANAYLDAKTPAASAGLVAHVDELAAIAGDLRQSGEVANLAFELIGEAGRDSCLPAVLKLVPSPDEVRMWAAVRIGLRCGGADAIVPLAEALPIVRFYERGIIEKYFWKRIEPLGDAARDPARTLLQSSSWVARWTGVELLGLIGERSDSPRARRLTADRARLLGFWGKDARRRPEPTLGQRASEIADRLEKTP